MIQQACCQTLAGRPGVHLHPRLTSTHSHMNFRYHTHHARSASDVCMCMLESEPNASAQFDTKVSNRPMLHAVETPVLRILHDRQHRQRRAYDTL